MGIAVKWESDVVGEFVLRFSSCVRDVVLSQSGDHHRCLDGEAAASLLCAFCQDLSSQSLFRAST